MSWFKRLLNGSQGRSPHVPTSANSPEKRAAVRAPEIEHLVANSAYAKAQEERQATGKPIPRKGTQARPAPSHRAPGVIYRSDYLSPDEEADLFTLAENGLPSGYLAVCEKRLVITPDGKPGAMVNPKSGRLYKLGIFSFSVRGTKYHERAVRSADLRPGKPVRLVREPGNAHDSNAIAIYAEHGQRPLGYVNKQNAARLAKTMEGGQEIAAISTRGNGRGSVDLVPMVLAARPEVLAHLMRKL